MGFGAVGMVMLAIVLVFYIRMIDGRMKSRRSSSEIKGILEKADVFESVADDASALKVIQQALVKHPNQPALLERESILKARLSSS